MATIFYSMSGEGRGHATRVRAIVEDLRTRHRVVLFAPGQAHSLLAPLYEGSDVEVRRIDGLAFHYGKDGILDYLGSARGALRMATRLPSLVGELRAALRVERPDLVVTDFEPLLPRAAEREGVPYVCIDHQHFLTEFSSRDLPPLHRFRAFLMGLAVQAIHRRQRLTVVSSFYRPPLKYGPFRKPVKQVGVLLGQDILSCEPSDGGFLLVYLRRETPRRVLRVLARSGLEARIYGTGREEGVEGNLSFHAIDRSSFVQDLSCCRALVSTAGNQVVGEALHLGKPVLALPETGNWEQEINGFWVERMGIGVCRDPRRLRSWDLAHFMANLDDFRRNMSKAGKAGNEDVARIVENVLAEISRERPSPLLQWISSLPPLLLGKAA